MTSRMHSKLTWDTVEPNGTLSLLVSDTFMRAHTQTLEEAFCLSLCHRSVVVSTLVTCWPSEVAFDDLSSCKSSAE